MSTLGEHSSQVALVVKDPPANAGDTGSGRSPRGGYGNPTQSFLPKNPVDSGTWQAAVHRVPQSWAQLKRLGTDTLEEQVRSGLPA